jgi:alkylation response protein AidB-like acyl-CoA dehydrogenase
VELSVEGVKVMPPEKKMGIRGALTSSILFDNAKVPAINLIGSEGDGLKIALATLNYGRIGVACQSLGVGWRAYDESLKYANTRRTFAKRLIEHQTIQNYLAKMRTSLDHATCYTLWVLKQREPLPRECAEAKLFASEACSKVVDLAVQIFGGNGYVEDYIVERLYRDIRITRIYEGSSEMQQQTIARFLEKEFLQL